MIVQYHHHHHQSSHDNRHNSITWLLWSRACSSMLFVSFSSFRLSSLFSLSRRLTLIMMMMRRSRMIMMMLHYPDIKVIIFKPTHVKNTLDNKTVNTMMTIWGKWPRVRKIKKIDGRISALLLKTMLLSSFEPPPRRPCELNIIINFMPILPKVFTSKNTGTCLSDSWHVQLTIRAVVPTPWDNSEKWI